MERKAIFIDVDGTLANDLGRVPESARVAVQAARANGHLIFLCTGRASDELWPEIRDIGFDGIIAAAGAHIEVAGEVLTQHVMPVADAREVLGFLDDHGMEYYLLTSHGMFATNGCIARARELVAERVTDPAMLAQVEKGLAPHFAALQITEDLVREDISKVCFLAGGTPMAEIVARFTPRFTVMPEVVKLFGPDSGELAIAGADKAAAIQTILEHVDVPRGDTFGYGDGLNDLAMLQYVQVAVAMGNAEPQIKAVAHEVTGSPDEDGIRTSFAAHGLI